MPTVNLDTAARLDIICRKGDSFNLVVEFDKSLADVAPDGSANGHDDLWSMHVKAAEGDTNTVMSNFTVAPVGQSGDDAKKLSITNSSSNMAGISAGLYVYDVQQSTGPAIGATTPGGGSEIIPDVTTYLFGTFEVREDVTDNT